jgi:glycosyltransferase involved in cell wall biosynthesis
MLIEAYILCNNEERLMPYIMRHYSQFAKVIILESCSTDNTKDLAHRLGAEIWSYNVPDEMNDRWFTDLKNTCWMESTANWVMIADADEFVYHKDIVKILQTTDATIIKPKFIEMYSEKYPTTKGQIYDEVNRGIEHESTGGNKMNVFRPDRVIEMNYAPGCHAADPKGVIKVSTDSGLLTLHMRNLSEKYVLERNKRHSERRSAINKENNWGDHVDFPIEEVIKAYHNGLNKSQIVI